MILSRAQRAMLVNAKSYIATVSRNAELAKDMVLAHALADVVAELHRIIEGQGVARPRMLTLTRKESSP